MGVTDRKDFGSLKWTGISDMNIKRSCFVSVMLALVSSTVMADVDLVTIPTREGVQLTIYNSEDITMVREHRLLTVKPGSTVSSSRGPPR